MEVEGIPEGWQLVRIGEIQHGEFFILSNGSIGQHDSEKAGRMNKNYVVIRKIEKPKKYRPFANAAEFEPHRDRWIKRKNSLGSASNFSGYGDKGVVMHGDVFTFDGLFLDHTFDDGTPFGVEVVE